MGAPIGLRRGKWTWEMDVELDCLVAPQSGGAKKALFSSAAVSQGLLDERARWRRRERRCEPSGSSFCKSFPRPARTPLGNYGADSEVAGARRQAAKHT